MKYFIIFRFQNTIESEHQHSDILRFLVNEIWRKIISFTEKWLSSQLFLVRLRSLLSKIKVNFFKVSKKMKARVNYIGFEISNGTEFCNNGIAMKLHTTVDKEIASWKIGYTTKNTFNTFYFRCLNTFFILVSSKLFYFSWIHYHIFAMLNQNKLDTNQLTYVQDFFFILVVWYFIFLSCLKTIYA